jgi:hypothetical protein
MNEAAAQLHRQGPAWNSPHAPTSDFTEIHSGVMRGAALDWGLRLLISFEERTEIAWVVDRKPNFPDQFLKFEICVHVGIMCCRGDASPADDVNSGVPAEHNGLSDYGKVSK